MKKQYKQKAEEIIRALNKHNLGAYLYHSAKSGSAYVKFENEALRSIRIADHEGRERYRYKYNLRRDIYKAEWKKEDGIWRYYCPMHRIDLLISQILKNKNYNTMGLGTNTTGSKTFLNIKEGKIARRLAGGGIETHDTLSGVLTGIAWHDGNYGRELHLAITDGADSFLLQMKWDGGYSVTFCKIIKNADLQLPMTFIPKLEERDGKKRSSFIIQQGIGPLKWFWTRDKPGDLPNLVKHEIRGQVVWDNTEQMAFFEKMLREEIIPNLPHPAVAGATAPAAKAATATTTDAPFEEDDLPF